MSKERVNNFIVEVSKTTHSGWAANINQLSTDFVGREVEVYHSSEFNFTSESEAKEWALTTIKE